MRVIWFRALARSRQSQVRGGWGVVQGVWEGGVWAGRVVAENKHRTDEKRKFRIIEFSGGDFTRRRHSGEWRSQGKSVSGDGAGAGPFANGGDVFGAGDAERLGGSDFGEKDLRGELLLGGERRIQARDDRLLDFSTGEAIGG